MHHGSSRQEIGCHFPEILGEVRAKLSRVTVVCMTGARGCSIALALERPQMLQCLVSQKKKMLQCLRSQKDTNVRVAGYLPRVFMEPTPCEKKNSGDCNRGPGRRKGKAQ